MVGSEGYLDGDCVYVMVVDDNRFRYIVVCRMFMFFFRVGMVGFVLGRCDLVVVEI